MDEKSLVIEKFVTPRGVYVCALIEFLTTFGTAITAVPTTRLIEGAICQRYYDTETPLPEQLCKIEGVQSSLAYLLGGYSALISLPGLFLAIPFQILSERIDRRFILLVNSLSSVSENIFLVAICVLPHTDLKLIWLCGVFELMGGGAAIHSMLIRTIIGEAVPGAHLSTLLYKMSGMNLALQLAGVSLGSWLLQNGAASTILLGTFIFSLIVPLLLFLPRTGPQIREPCLSDDPIQINYVKFDQKLQRPQSETRQATTHPFQIQANLKIEVLNSLKALVTLIRDNQSVKMCLAVNFLNQAAFNARFLLRAWTSKRYDWSLSDTGYILSLEATLSVIILFLLQYFDPSSIDDSRKRKREVSVAKFSMLCGIIGSIILCFAETRFMFFVAYIVLSGSVGFLDAIRGYFRAQMRTEDVGRLYSMVMMVSTLATIISAPIWSAIYALGYDWQGIWVGLPFLVSSGVMVLTLVLVACLKT